MKKQNNIFIISCGMGKENLSPNALKFIEDAQIIIGGLKLLDEMQIQEEKRIIFTAKNITQIKELLKTNKDKKITVLASGDSLYCGIGSWVARFLDKNSFTILPNITAFQYLCSKLKLDWQNISLFSVHGKNIQLQVMDILRKPLAIIYGDDKRPANKIAGELIKVSPQASNRKGVIACNLGKINEKITTGSLETLAREEDESLSILLILPPSNIKQVPAMQIGLPDSYYEHEKNLITHSEIRAVILSKLSIRPGSIMWDLGSGSGSVGIEVAAISPLSSIYSVEKHPQRIKDIEQNIQKSALNNITVIHGNILDKLKELPNPDIVFIGGGGKDLKEITLKAYDKLSSEGRMVVSAVTLESISTLNAIIPEKKKEVITISVSRSQSVGQLTMMKGENPITIFTFIKK